MLKNAQKDFIQRHIGPSMVEQDIMLKELGYKSLDELIKDTVDVDEEMMEVPSGGKDTKIKVMKLDGGNVHEMMNKLLGGH